MDIGAVFAWIFNAVVCGLLAVLALAGWIRFIWIAVNARRACQAGVYAQATEREALQCLDETLQALGDWPCGL